MSRYWSGVYTARPAGVTRHRQRYQLRCRRSWPQCFRTGQPLTRYDVLLRRRSFLPTERSPATEPPRPSTRRGVTRRDRRPLDDQTATFAACSRRPAETPDRMDPLTPSPRPCGEPARATRSMADPLRGRFWRPGVSPGVMLRRARTDATPFPETTPHRLRRRSLSAFGLARPRERRSRPYGLRRRYSPTVETPEHPGPPGTNQEQGDIQ